MALVYERDMTEKFANDGSIPQRIAAYRKEARLASEDRGAARDLMKPQEL
ncbi:hypothetical protein ACVWYQ_002377 [Bradyrhizobium sp. USDA 3397]